MIRRWLQLGVFLLALLPVSSFAAWGAADGKCTTQNSSTGTSLQCTVSTANLDAGNVAFMLFGGDNTATTDVTTALITAVTDSQSNTWKIDHCYTNGQGSAGAGATVCLAHSVLTATLTSGVDTITVTHSSITSRAMVTFEYTIAGGSTVYAHGINGANSVSTDIVNDALDPGSIVLGQVMNGEHLWIRATALERTSGGTWTVSTNFTTMGCNGTNTGTSTNDMEVCGEYRIVTSTSQTSDPTGTAVDSASIGFVFTEATMPAGFVQECHNGIAAAGTVRDCTFATHVTAGNLLACYVYDQSTTDTVTMSDTLSNTWTNQATYYTDSTNTRRSLGVYAKNALAGYTVVTSTWNVSTSQRGIACHEISGMDTVSPDDGYVGQNQQNPGTGTDAITSTSITTTGTTGYLFGGTFETSNGCNNITAGTGWTAVIVNGCQFPHSAARATSSAGSYAATFTTGTSTADYNTLIQAFKAAAGPSARTLMLLGVGR